MASDNRHLYAVILAGGASSRFWPMNDQPKYLIKPDGHTTLLELAYARCEAIAPKDHILVVTAERQTAMVQTVLPRLKSTHVLAEPERRDTLAAITYAVETIARGDAEAIVIVTAADLLFTPNTCFGTPLKSAIKAKVFEGGALACFGVKPTHPETGFGYIKPGKKIATSVFEAEAFIEKPSAKKAREYLKRGYLWNSGSFAWRATAFLSEVQRQQPELFNGVRRFLDTRNVKERRAIYAALPTTSVDYGVIEGAREIAILEASARFNDIGTWDALAELGKLQAAHVVAVDAKNCRAVSDGTVAIIGIDDVIVVQHGDKTLIMKRGSGQRVKEISARLKELGRE